MSAIKKFFEKRKADSKFKAAGPGHKLTESQSTSNKPHSKTPPKPTERVQPTQSSQMAGVAAIQRIQQQQRNVPSMANRSMNVIRAEALKEIEQEAKLKKQSTPPREDVLDSPPILTVNGVFFTCALVGPDILPKAEMEARIKEFLYQQLEEERGLTACLIIHTCNKDKEKVRLCVETLCKCLDNVIENPAEEKYRKIRVNTKAFQEKLKSVEGAVEFLLAAGFEQKLLPHGDEQEEFYVLPAEKLENMDDLTGLRDALISAEPIRPELDRNTRVLSSCHLLQRVELPPEFYNLTVEDLKREQMLKSEEVEKNLMLRTKAMREREAMRELRRYRFCLVRVRFPDGLILQGTFKAWEKFSALKEFVREHLLDDLPFILSMATGHQLLEDESTLAELGLVPAVIINFAWDPSIVDDVARSGKRAYLNPDTLLLRSDKSLI